MAVKRSEIRLHDNKFADGPQVWRRRSMTSARCLPMIRHSIDQRLLACPRTPNMDLPNSFVGDVAPGSRRVDGNGFSIY